MAMDISIERISRSRLSDIDINNVPFGREFSDHMFEVDFVDGKWQNPRIRPTQKLSIHPSNMALHYGQSIFEGMKAGKDPNGIPLLFRPEMNARRLIFSAERMGMQPYPEADFLEALYLLIDIDKDWIPTAEGSSLYIRPIMFATDEYVGVRPSETYKFMILTCPVGPYYGNPVKLLASTEFIRAAVGGVGEAKTAGNYAAALYPSKKALEEGCDQVLWLDAKEFKYIQEVGTMNIMFRIGDKIITPVPDGAILHGITRLSFLQILKDEGYQVEERKISIDEVIAAQQEGTLIECFGAGTAAVATPVSSIKYKGVFYQVNKPEGELSIILKERIQAMRKGTAPDPYGWIKRVQVEMAS